VEVETLGESLLGPSGLRFRGHQFRHCTLDQTPPGGCLRVRRVPGGAEHQEGWGKGRVVGSWVHAHFASCPALAEGLVKAARG
jgi:cobyrinic acid a,c-diamide synthase